MCQKKWRAVVFYCEPTYDLHRRRGEPREFQEVTVVKADTADEAAEFASARIRGLSRMSAVNWVREVLRVEVEPMPDDTNGVDSERQ